MTPSTDRTSRHERTDLSAEPVARQVHGAYQQELDPTQRATLLSWSAFTVTFLGVRAITHAIRAGIGPFGNLSFGGEHLHHYLWGIGMIAGAGAVGVHGDDDHRRHPAVALAYGAGLALIVDEFALLLDLEDVYWSSQGRVSVELGVGGIAGVGTFVAGAPLLRRLRAERRKARARG